jgi:hypothetical protein
MDNDFKSLLPMKPSTYFLQHNWMYDISFFEYGVYCNCCNRRKLRYLNVYDDSPITNLNGKFFIENMVPYFAIHETPH